VLGEPQGIIFYKLLIATSSLPVPYCEPYNSRPLMNVRRRKSLIQLGLMSILALSTWARAQCPATTIPNQYQRLFYQCAERHSLWEKALNTVGLTGLEVGRSYALIAGVSHYPKFALPDRYLGPADVDIQRLEQYLKEQEFFDEIVVLKDDDLTLENLNYFLDDYFPEKLKQSPHSRFLFAYSGHGYADGVDQSARGFLLKSSATSLKDSTNAIDLRILRALMDSVVDSAEKSLVLINSCHSGAFIERKPFGGSVTINTVLKGKGAHAIVASTLNENSWSGEAGGSVFFDKIFAGLNGAADKFPEDGVVTFDELYAYLRGEIPLATHGSQTPMEGDISRDGSVGEFFFLNRNRQLQAGSGTPWNPKTATAFGDVDPSAVAQGQQAYREGRYSDATTFFKQAAEAGDDHAMTYLGIFYEVGAGVSKDYQQALYWYERAVDAGNADAMNKIGQLYENGTGVTKNYVQARHWYARSAALGNKDGSFYLAELYANGRGVPRDSSQARKWFERASSGSPQTMGDIGSLYEFGSFLPQDSKEALWWYEKAAAGAYPDAMTRLGVMYESGDVVAQDYVKARSWYEKSAALSNSESMHYLGELYAKGQGIAQDYQKARYWYQKSSDAGEWGATVGLGVLYEEGRGGPQDYTKARLLYEKAAAAGEISAMTKLGVLYETGHGVPRNIQRARSWYEKATAAGDSDAQKRLKALPK
jgi:uncharacterized protein